ncbi:hypothetical protein DKM44_03155 [Deinococcus irradiatisoli]|uniref:Response regulatory domain-containing protein n=1 Tax=Deinococcus irradiatisoli TaxID=2202254 RepID=A0A2Z3JE81_9DEIO|nr:response regulator [Deinococcus irradiatisoli]AWN22356.1 hypothetical protein DKM44_03155 [Deinococcus irradiatisoli]
MTEILVAEARLGVRKALERLIEGLGMRPRSVSSAAQLRRELLRQRPDVVILGLGLPDEDGAALCRELQPEQLNVLLLGQIDEGAARVAGAAGVLQLPLEPLELAAQLHHLLGTAPPELGDTQLLQQLMERPGVLAITTYDAAGTLKRSAGDELPMGLGQRARTYLDASRWLGGAGEGLPALRGAGLATRELCVIQVEYGERCLLLFEEPGGITACLLRDSASASLMKYWLRSSRHSEGQLQP